MPRISSGGKNSPVVNKSRIEWTKLKELEDICYLVVGTNNYWFDCFLIINMQRLNFYFYQGVQMWYLNKQHT